MARIDKAGLQVEDILARFIDDEALPGTGVDPVAFWQGFSDLVHDLAPRNRTLLEMRETLQTRINTWHAERAGQAHDPDAYKSFLTEIGYIVPKGPAFAIETENVDPEIAAVPGPQLVVPIMNARYALNAANARWGSLYDAFYGTDALGNMPAGGGYSKDRGARVIARARAFLDETFPLAGASHADAQAYRIEGGALTVDGKPLADPAQFVGHRGDGETPDAVLLRNNGLHVELHFDLDHPIGQQDKAGMSDVVMEAAVTAIMDCEDSVAAVDSGDKRLCTPTGWV